MPLQSVRKRYFKYPGQNLDQPLVLVVASIAKEVANVNSIT